MQNVWKLSGIALVWAASVFGQASAVNGEIAGTVTDPSGAIVPGASVQLSGGGKTFSATSGGDGKGNFGPAPPARSHLLYYNTAIFPP